MSFFTFKFFNQSKETLRIERLIKLHDKNYVHSAVFRCSFVTSVVEDMKGGMFHSAHNKDCFEVNVFHTGKPGKES